MQTLFKRVVTHSGLFHADEVFAVALIEYFFKTLCQVTRTRDLSTIVEGQADRDVWVIDVGGKFKPEMNNFDHHQDRGLMASNVLVWEELKHQRKVPDYGPAYNHMYEFLGTIAGFDVNTGGIHQKWSQFTDTYGHGLRHVNMLIRSFNRNSSSVDEQNRQFRKAVDFAKEMIHNEWYAAQQIAQQARIYSDGFELSDSDVMFFYEFCSIWKEKGHMLAMMPHTDGWMVQTANTGEYPLPADENAKFLHASKFMIIFESRIHAERYAHALPRV